MVDATDTIRGAIKRPLSQDTYSLDPEELAFYEAQTGITDEDELKLHIMQVQAEAYEVKPYNCIRTFGFLRLKVWHLSAYEQLLQLGKERKDAIFLDVGCCFGTDVRKAVADGFPAGNSIASDIETDFWKAGHKLFNSSAETFPVPFIPGDAFNDAFLKQVPPFYSPPDTPRPELSALTTLTPVLGHVSAIHASCLFHLFGESEQLQLARSLAGLLSPTPGSMLCGWQCGRQEKGYRPDTYVLDLERRDNSMFCHSPESWKELWDGQVFEKGTVKVEAKLAQRHDTVVEGVTLYAMDWSVTRL